MGIKLNSAKLIFEAYASGVRFDRTLTLGRQFITGNPQIFDGLKRLYGVEHAFRLPETYGLQPPFAEPLFAMVGATKTDAIDASDYEGANIVFDLNREVPDTLRDQYDCVFDTGTLEHIFNFPQSIKNCMDMVKTGGHLFLQFPADNFCGHGFYQFSPELFFRVLCRANGFSVEWMVAYEDIETPTYFLVSDPAAMPLKTRLRLGKTTTHCPTLCTLLAKKLHAVGSLQIPQQSSYQASWDATFIPAAKAAMLRPSTASLIRRTIRKAAPGAAAMVVSFQRKRRLAKNTLFASAGLIAVGKLTDRLSLPQFAQSLG